MSGHASFSFYCATFLILYLQARLNKFPDSTSKMISTLKQILKVLRPFLQFAIFSLAFWIALTRISDYFHHPLDVTMGSLVGIGFAIITVSVGDIFNRPMAFAKTLHKKLSSKGNNSSPKNMEFGNIKTFQDYVKHDKKKSFNNEWLNKRWKEKRIQERK